MGAETVLEWLNENEFRAFPLVDGPVRLCTCGEAEIDLHRLILDANFVYRAPLPPHISLTGITKVGAQFRFFVTGLPYFGVTGTSDPAAFPLYVRNTNNDLLVLGVETLKLFNNWVGDISFLTVEFEPSVAIEQTGLLAGVSSVSFNTVTLDGGDIQLVEGVQTGILFLDQTIQLTVGRNQGRVLACTSYFTEPDDCGSVVSSINGANPRVSGGNITLVAGDHVKLFEDPARARIYIGLDFTGVDACTAQTLPPIP